LRSTQIDLRLDTQIAILSVKENIDKLNSSKIKSLSLYERLNKVYKRASYRLEEKIYNHKSDKGLLSPMYRELSKVNSKKPKQSN
jgi:hypothetical protein